MVFRPPRMKFGIFLAPFHAIDEDPTLALERDFELVQHLDRIGFDEAWVGEHHSAGWEIIGDPVAFIAAAAERTKHIKLGTGVISLPYHHPFIVANRMVQLDHQTRGRAMLGVGPGALSSDAFMMGFDPMEQRRRMDESLAAIMALLRAEAPVTMQTDWFTLREARLQLASYTYPHLPVAVANVLTPAGATSAGRQGVGILSIGASMPGGLVSLAETWRWGEEAAAENGRTMDRNDWRLVIQMHLADSKDEAIRQIQDVRLRELHNYWQGVGDRPKPSNPHLETVEFAMDAGGMIVGTPDDAITAIERMLDLSGGFGGLLFIAQEWATTEQRHHSFELFARYVAPHFRGQLEPRHGTTEWVAGAKPRIYKSSLEITRKAFADSHQELPEALEKMKMAEELAKARSRV